jgi:hypothetical protein
MERYDADTAPDAEQWLALDEEQRTTLIRRHHRGRVLRIHPDRFDLKMHSALHLIVENQVAAGEPEGVRRTVERLTGAGLRRHAAVHMVMEVLLHTVGGHLEPERYEQNLEKLDAGSWLGERMRRDLGS